MILAKAGKDGIVIDELSGIGTSLFSVSAKAYG